jgi:hypothetical protein
MSAYSVFDPYRTGSSHYELAKSCLQLSCIDQGTYPSQNNYNLVWRLRSGEFPGQLSFYGAPNLPEFDLFFLGFNRRCVERPS